MEDIKEEIKLLTMSNKEIKTLIYYLKKYPDDESDSAEVNVSNKNETQNTFNENKCSGCGFVVNTLVSF